MAERRAWRAEGSRMMGVKTVVVVLALACLCLDLLPSVLAAPSVKLACQDGWTNTGLHCYRLFPQQMSWDLASDTCHRYGAQLLKIKDLAGKEAALGALLEEHGVSLLWLAYARSAQSWPQEPEQPSSPLPHPNRYHPPHFITPTTSARPETGGHLPGGVTIGQTENEMVMMTMNSTSPLPLGSGQCVIARFVGEGKEEEEEEEAEGELGGRVRVGAEIVWGFAPCLRQTAFLCQKPASPEGAFQCSNGRFVDRQFVCDGDDDCGDLSDEINCEDLCHHHLQATSGVLKIPEWTEPTQSPVRCVWLLEAPVGYNAHLEVQFTKVSAADVGEEDTVVVLVGGLTVSTSRRVAPAYGEGQAMSCYVSVNNLMMVIVAVTPDTRFSASFTALKAEGFEPQQKVTATWESQELKSPFYPVYLSGQDYVWVISALSPFHTLTIQIIHVDLRGEDTVEIRDGNSVFAPLLQVLTSSWHGKGGHVLSTGRHVFIALRTRGLVTGQGFLFRYWQGCSIGLEDTSGSVVSPGYLLKGTNYPANQTCVYDVTVPELKTVTLVFDEVDIHRSDELRIESDGQWIHSVTGQNPPDPIDLSSGSFRLTFVSDLKVTSRGFALRYSVGCPALPTNALTTVHPPSPDHHFGSRVTLTCSKDNAFPPLEPRVQSEAVPATTLVLECLFAGVWNVTGSPVCKALCKPGWFYEGMTESCEQCPMRHYQSEVNATSCLPCPLGTVTENAGANSSSECKPECPAGQRFCRKLGACEDCPIGTFQSRSGQFACLPCPLFKTTPRAGANSSSFCSVEVMDKDTEQELDDQELIVVSFQSNNNDHHHHNHHHYRRIHHRPTNSRPDSTLRLPSPLSTFLLPPRNSNSNAARMGLPESVLSEGRAEISGGHEMARTSGRGLVDLYSRRSAASALTPSRRAKEVSRFDSRWSTLSHLAKSERESRWLKFLESAANSEGEGESMLKEFVDIMKQWGEETEDGRRGRGGAGGVEGLSRLELSILMKENSAEEYLRKQRLAEAGGQIWTDPHRPTWIKGAAVDVLPQGGDDGDTLPGGRGVEDTVAVVDVGPGWGAHMEERRGERSKRAVAAEGDPDEEEGSCSGDGSGFDPCEATGGQPCDAKRDCVETGCYTYECVCKPVYQENQLGECVDVPENQKLYLTTPLNLTFDPDLSLQRSEFFLSFQMTCQEALTQVFCGVEGWKYTQILYFRSEVGGNEQTIVVYSLLLTVPVMEDIKVKVAQAVLSMENEGWLLLDSTNVSLAGHTGIFDMLSDTNTNRDSVDWCEVASLHHCSGDKQCVDGGLRYTCQCPGSTSEIGGACVSVGAIAGGVVGVLVIVIIIIVVVIFVVKCRRRKQRDYNRTHGDDIHTPQQDSALPLHDRRNKTETVEPSVYSQTRGAVTSHAYETFHHGDPNTPGNQPGQTGESSEPVVETNVYTELSDTVTPHAYETFRAGTGPSGSSTDEYTSIAL